MPPHGFLVTFEAMDIRTKLVLALVALALGSMLTLGGVMYKSAEEHLADVTHRQLDAIGLSSESAIDQLISGWRDRVQLIASRTQLRLSLREYSRSGDEGELERIDRILEDARASVETLRSLAVYGADGNLVIAVGEPVEPMEPAAANDEPVRFVSASVDEGGHPQVAFSTDLLLDDETLGVLLVVLSGEELIDLTRSFPGLGETGEILIVARDGDGIHALHPARHSETGEFEVVRLEGAERLAIAALAGEEDVFAGGLTNYRGETVWAATRHIDDTKWGVVVKFDDAEVRRSTSEFRTEMTTLALSLSAFAILFAVLLGMRFATPIHHLAEVANRIRGGELDARATVKREDEIGLLARTFNQMADKLEERMVELHKFHKFFEVSLDMLCIAGTDGYFKRVNPAFETTLGWSAEALMGYPFMNLVHPDDVAPTVAEIEKLSQGIPTISFVNRFRCADGTYKRLLWTSHPEPDGTLYAIAREIADPAATP